MNNRHIADVYKRTQVETVDQKTLIVMCYDAAIRSLKLGKDCYLKKDFEEKAKQFNRAQGLISELLSSLNLDAGGIIARNLSAIYNFLLRHILDGDIRGDMKAIEDVIEILSELKSTWEEIGAKPAMIDKLTNQAPAPEKTPERPRVSLSIGI